MFRDFFSRYDYQIYRIQELTGNLYTKFKPVIIAVGVTGWAAFLGLAALEVVGYTKHEATKGEVYVDFAKETIKEAELLINIGDNSRAFILLATQLNHFKDSYTEEQIQHLQTLLTNLTPLAKEMKVAELYAQKDLTEVQPIVRFKGVINAVDDDVLYGHTATISDDGSRSMEQVEVTGLTQTVEGSEVTFYGVPEFKSVDRPIQVEAFVVADKKEDKE